MAQSEIDSMEAKEANGLCYLDIVDFTGDGEDGVITVCKNEKH